MVNTMNKEPSISTYGKLGEWVEIANDTPITNDMVENFVIQIFRLLEVNEMCFSSGAFVFENYGNVLFNILTFNKLFIPNKSYYCDDPLGIDLTGRGSEIIQPENVHILGTETHAVYYNRPGRVRGYPIQINPRQCMPATKFSSLQLTASRTKTKFERIFNPKIKNICGHCEVPETEKSEPKGVILYYPFYATSLTYPSKTPRVNETKTPLLYVKLEGASVTENMLTHSFDLISKTVGIKKQYKNLDTRREDKCNYNEKYRDKDIEFYTKYCPEDIEILKWYNVYIRAGCEFFVSKGLLTYFIKSFLLTSFNCNSSLKESSPKKSSSKKSSSKKSSPKKSLLEKNKKMSVGGKIKYKTKRNTKSNKTINTRRYFT